MKELTGELRWPEPTDGQDHRRRYKGDEVAAGLDGKPLVPQEFGSDEQIDRWETEVAELLQGIFSLPIDCLHPKWQRTFEASVARNGEGLPQVERVTYRPVMISLREVSSELKGEGIVVERGVNAGNGLAAWQVQEWKLRAGVPRFVKYFFELHPEVMQAYLQKREKLGERRIPQEELLQRFTDGVIRLLRGQK